MAIALVAALCGFTIAQVESPGGLAWLRSFLIGWNATVWTYLLLIALRDVSVIPFVGWPSPPMLAK